MNLAMTGLQTIYNHTTVTIIFPKYPNKYDSDVAEYIGMFEDIEYFVANYLISTKIAYRYCASSKLNSTNAFVAISHPLARSLCLIRVLPGTLRRAPLGWQIAWSGPPRATGSYQAATLAPSARPVAGTTDHDRVGVNIGCVSANICPMCPEQILEPYLAVRPQELSTGQHGVSADDVVILSAA